MTDLQSFCVTALLFGGLSVAAPRSEAAMPVGFFSYTNSDVTNALWDLSQVSQLQNMEVGVSKLGAAIRFSVQFDQDAAGKFSGEGTTNVNVTSPPFSGTIPVANYKVVGHFRSKDGEGRVSYVASISTIAMIDGRARVVKSAAARTMALDSVNKTFSGTYRNSASASGLGGGAEAGEISYTWAEIQTALGDGGWKLEWTLADAGKNQITGTAAVLLNSGPQWLFTVKGVYNPKTDTSKLVLIPTLSAKGASLRVEMSGASVTDIRGKISGQAIDVSLSQ